MVNKKEKSPSVAHTLYSGTAVYGKLLALTSAIIGTIIGVIGIVVGIVFLSTTGGYTKDATAKVTADSICTDTPTKEDPAAKDCSTKIRYADQEKNISTDGTSYSKGTTVTVWYKTDDHSEVTFDNPGNKTALGWIFLVIGIVLPLILWGWYLLTRKFKAAAAVGGVAGAASMVSGTFSN